jgi:hypothetical protein
VLHLRQSFLALGFHLSEVERTNRIQKERLLGVRARWSSFQSRSQDFDRDDSLSSRMTVLRPSRPVDETIRSCGPCLWSQWITMVAMFAKLPLSAQQFLQSEDRGPDRAKLITEDGEFWKGFVCDLNACTIHRGRKVRGVWKSTSDLIAYGDLGGFSANKAHEWRSLSVDTWNVFFVTPIDRFPRLSRMEMTLFYQYSTFLMTSHANVQRDQEDWPTFSKSFWRQQSSELSVHKLRHSRSLRLSTDPNSWKRVWLSLTRWPIQGIDLSAMNCFQDFRLVHSWGDRADLLFPLDHCNIRLVSTHNSFLGTEKWKNGSTSIQRP